MAVTKIEKKATNLSYVFLIDWNDDGILKEIAVVDEKADGTIYGIQVDRLHPIDKARLRRVITSVHAGKYPLWELLAQGRLNNGLNSLDFFHSNYVKVKRPKGASLGGGLASLELDVDTEVDRMIGSSLTDTQGAASLADDIKSVSF